MIRVYGSVMKKNICLIDRSVHKKFAQIEERLQNWDCRYNNMLSLELADLERYNDNVTMIYIMEWKNEESDLYRIKLIKRQFVKLLIIVFNPNDFPIRRAMRIGAYAVLSSTDTLEDLEEIGMSIL
mgnify:CR=1 FL=1